MVARIVAAAASRTDSQNEDVRPGTSDQWWYQWVVNPFQAKLICGSPVVTRLKL